jgi:hypothetical protein
MTLNSQNTKNNSNNFMKEFRTVETSYNYQVEQ